MLPTTYIQMRDNATIALYTILYNIVVQITYHVVACVLSLHWIRMIVYVNNRIGAYVVSIVVCVVITGFKCMINDIVIYDNKHFKYNFNTAKIIMIWTFDYFGFYFGALANKKSIDTMNAKIDNIKTELRAEMSDMKKEITNINKTLYQILKKLNIDTQDDDFEDVVVNTNGDTIRYRRNPYTFRE